MNAAATRPEVGDYDLRTIEVEKALVCAVHPHLIDADRSVRDEWCNGFPNWALYRDALAGDTLYALALKDWVIAFAYRVGQVVLREAAFTEELTYLAGQDALAMLRANREVIPYTLAAAAVDANPKTYKRLRDLLYRMLKATTDEYWVRLGAEYRYTMIRHRKVS